MIMITEFKINNSKIPVIIDDYNFDRISKYSWHLISRREVASKAIRTNYGGGIYLHRLILNVFNPKIFIDHKDGNIFNNSESNLRIATISQNNHNSRISRKNNVSGCKGVYFENFTKKWKAVIMVNKKRIILGRFKEKVLAAIAYDDAAIIHHGEFARLNFPLYGA